MDQINLCRIFESVLHMRLDKWTWITTTNLYILIWNHCLNQSFWTLFWTFSHPSIYLQPWLLLIIESMGVNLLVNHSEPVTLDLFAQLYQLLILVNLHLASIYRDIFYSFYTGRTALGKYGQHLLHRKVATILQSNNIIKILSFWLEYTDTKLILL